MSSGFHLDIATLLICGHILLLVMAGALTTVRSAPSRSSSGLNLWSLSIGLFILPGLLLMADGRFAWPAYLPPWLTLVAALLASASVLQWFTLREVAGHEVRRREVASSVSLAFVLNLAIAWMLPQEYQPKLISAMHVLVPLWAIPSLVVITRGGAGGLVVSVSMAVGVAANVAALANGINVRGGEPSVLILCDVFSLFGATLGLLLWHQERIQRLLTQTAVTDALTGALNRHGLMPRLESELARAQRSGRPVSIVLCDLDHFKRINDGYGHAVGDLVLKAFASSAERLMRQGDLMGRWGGEEFLFILPDTATRDAVVTTERVRGAQAPALPGMPKVTFSAGVVTSGHNGSCYCPMELLAAADKLLYVAKETRDRIVCSLAPDLASSQAGRKTQIGGAQLPLAVSEQSREDARHSATSAHCARSHSATATLSSKSE